jgi:hypothetical protein
MCALHHCSERGDVLTPLSGKLANRCVKLLTFSPGAFGLPHGRIVVGDEISRPHRGTPLDEEAFRHAPA